MENYLTDLLFDTRKIKVQNVVKSFFPAIKRPQTIRSESPLKHKKNGFEN
jgi:hypothetical protein